MIRYDSLHEAMTRQRGKSDAYEMYCRWLGRAKVIRVANHFIEDLTRDPAPGPIGFGVLHPVFPIVHVEIEGGYNSVDRDGRPYRIENMTIVCFDIDESERDQVSGKDVHSIFGVTAWGTRKRSELYERYYGDVIADAVEVPGFVDFGKDGNVLDSEWTNDAGVARNILDFLASPSVFIERDPDVDKINHARKRKDKPPLTDWHVVSWSDAAGATTAIGSGMRHRVRYDVRGNWATYRVGPLAGARIWRRAHQRGLANELFRPKGYAR